MVLDQRLFFPTIFFLLLIIFIAFDSDIDTPALLRILAASSLAYGLSKNIPNNSSSSK